MSTEAASATVEVRGEPPERVGWTTVWGWRLAVALVVLCAQGMAAYWAWITPIFQAPDEQTHWDYALCIAEQGRLMRTSEMLPREKWKNSIFPVDYGHPYTEFLLERTGFEYLLCPPAKMPRGYGTAAWFRELDEAAPKRSEIRIEHAPGMTGGYPFGFYAVLGVWIAGVRLLTDSVSVLFFASRGLSVLLLGISLLACYGCLRELRASRPWALLMTALVGSFPLTLFVASYIQPDNLALALGLVTVYVALRTRSEPHNAGQLVCLGLLIGAMYATKLHVFLAVGTAVAGLLGSRWISRGSTVRQMVCSAVIMGLAAAPFWLTHQWVLEGAGNPYSTLGAGPRTPGEVVSRVWEATLDYFTGQTHVSFWGLYGWLNTPLRFGSERDTLLFRRLTLLASVLTLLLAAVRMERVVSRLVQIAWSGRWKTSLRLALSDPLLISAFAFTGVMYLIYVKIGAAFCPQGRNWIAVLPGIFLVATAYAPRAFSLKPLRVGTQSLAVCGLALFCAVSLWFAPKSLRERYYEPAAVGPVTVTSLPLWSPCPTQVKLENGRYEVLGNNPSIPFVFPKQYVHAIRFRGVFTHPTPIFSDLWINYALNIPGGGYANHGQENFHIRTDGAEVTVTVFPQREIDLVSITPDRKPAWFELRSLELETIPAEVAAAARHRK